MRWVGLLACGALGACRFDLPTVPAVADGPTDGSVIPPDEMMGDARLCFGAGLGMLCLAKAPTAPLVLGGTIDTSAAASCSEIINVAGGEACVLAGSTVD